MSTGAFCQTCHKYFDTSEEYRCKCAKKVYEVYLLDANGEPEELPTFSYPTKGEAMDHIDDLYADGIGAVCREVSAAKEGKEEGWQA